MLTEKNRWLDVWIVSHCHVFIVVSGVALKSLMTHGLCELFTGLWTI